MSDSGQTRRIVVDGAPGPLHSSPFVFLNIAVMQTVGRAYFSVYKADMAPRPITSCVDWFATGGVIGGSILSRCQMIPGPSNPLVPK